MTRQEIFSKIRKHLLTQMEKSEAHTDRVNPANGEPINMCLYRGPDGLKCAIGALIPDEAYKPDMEGMGVDSIIAAIPGASTEDGTFLLDLQELHDEYMPNEWAGKLGDFAEAHGLLNE